MLKVYVLHCNNVFKEDDKCKHFCTQITADKNVYCVFQPLP